MNLDIYARALLDSLKEGILVTDAQSRICFGNKAYLEFLKKELNEIKGKRLGDLRSEAAAAGVIKMYPVIHEGEMIGGVAVINFNDDTHHLSTGQTESARKKPSLALGAAMNQTCFTLNSIVAQAPASRRAKEWVEWAAKTDIAVLLEGEKGTGKRVFAEAIHNGSERNRAAFMVVDCANICKASLETEFFRCLAAARGGTLYLNDVSDMPLPLQAKVFEIMCTQLGVRPVGAEATAWDSRLICASSVNLKRCVEDGNFHRNLYEQLAFCAVEVPPLRRRKEDLPELAKTMLKDYSRRHKRPFSLAEETIACLQNYLWPGNVRELQNVMEYATLFSRQDVIHKEDLPEHLVKYGPGGDPLRLTQQVRAFERREIMRLLAINGFDLKGKRLTAEQLGISLASLYNKMKMETREPEQERII